MRRIESGKKQDATTRTLSLTWLCACLGLSGTTLAQTLEPTWSFDSDGSWIADTVSLGDRGAQVFSEVGAYVNSRVLFSSGDSGVATAIWSDAQLGFNFHRQVASSADSNVHASMHQAFVDANMSWKRAVLFKYSSDRSVPDWSFEFPGLIVNHSHSKVAVSADGSRIVGAVYDSAALATHVAVFGEQSSTPLYSHQVSTFGAFEGFVLSADGKRAAFRSTMKLVIFNLESGVLEHEEYLLNSTFYGALALSADGSTLAMGTGNEVLAYQLEEGGGNNYAKILSEPLGAGNFATRLGLSGNGQALYWSVNNFSTPSRIELHGFDLLSGATLIDYQNPGSGSYLNLAEGLEVSGDGQRIALGLWGDENDQVPELLLFQAGNNTPLASFATGGSISALDMSPSGSHVVIAARGAHATQFGGGGSLMLFEVPGVGVSFQGVPRQGATITLSQAQSGSNIARMLRSNSLEATPSFFPSGGLLYLERAALTWLPQGSQNSQGQLETQFDLGSSAAQGLGDSIYFQGVGLAPRSLSENYLKITILP